MQSTIKNKLVSLVFLLAVLTSCNRESSKAPDVVSIIPKPVSVTMGQDWLTLPSAIEIVAKTEDEKNVAALLQEFLKTKQITASVVPEGNKDASIVLATGLDTLQHKEHYTLNVDDSGINIRAVSGAGLFYGAQSLIQLFPSHPTGTIALPHIAIDDAPRFAYRGLHLDVGRHMFPVAFIKKYIDLLARHKLNTFHWHLTEDQGWRIEIKKYPKLQEIAAYRKETLVGHYGSDQYDGTRYGGYYTQDEIRDVVRYAAERYVTVVPEIEMPGHSVAALAAYPNLGCTGGPYEVRTTWAVADDVYCAGKEETFEFLEGVLDEVITLFPGKYIHIGGDECPKTRWKECRHCQKRIKTEKLRDEHELQSYFIQRMEKYLNSKGKQIIGWDEILEGGLAPKATVMSWRGEEGGIAAAKENHDVIMTPGNWCYFDNYQDSAKTEPLAIGGLTPVSEVYSYEPLPSQLNDKEAAYILGAQGNVWTEYMTTSDYVEYMVYPRACALAEVVWSPREARNYDDFAKRMLIHRQRLDEWKVNYATHMFKTEAVAVPVQQD